MFTLATLMAFIQTHGYALVFVFTLLEGETIVALAGFVAYQGYLNLVYVIIVAIIGAFIGDQAFFIFGRLKGKQYIEARPKMVARVARVHRLIENHQNWLIFASRFMYGFRAILPIAMGTSKVRWQKFALLDFLGAIVWGIFFAGGGYIFGNALEQFIGHVKRVEIIIAGVLVGALLAQLIGVLRRRVEKKIEKEERRAEQVDAAPPKA